MGNVFAKLRKFSQDENGIALILVAIMLPVIIGFSLLVIDMSRANNLHFDLQRGADSLALAAAAELDGRSDAITRADHALATLVANQYRFAGTGGAQTLTDAGIERRFLKSIPDDDSKAIRDDVDVIHDEEDDAKEARFIEVTVNPVGFSAIFPASFINPAASSDFNVGATAVAGFLSGVCDYTPVFICNPYETPSEAGDVTLEMAASTREYRRRQILMRKGGFYRPGNFAFLESPFGNGANALEDMLAKVKPPGCYSRDGVNTKPGQNTGPVEDGLNARFGISKPYIGTADGPAANVRMGLKSIDCKKGAVTFETDPNKGVGLERDSCHITGTCTMMDNRMGAGDWNFARYWAANHPTRPVPTALSGTGVDLPTRYEVYRYELNPDGDPTTNDSIVNDVAVSGETGIPACNQTPITTVDRRLLYGAILDCGAIPGFNGKMENVPVRAFASFFITEPIRDDKDIYVELVDITGRGGRGTLDNFLRDEAQLYR